MRTDEEIQELAREYAENENSAYTNDYYGFVNGFKAGLDEIVKIIEDNPNDGDLGAVIRSKFLQKGLIYDRGEH